MKSFVTHAIAIYVGAGIFGASLVLQAVPAVNLFGMTYISLTWPRLIYCAPIQRGCDPMPPEWVGKYMFSFPEVTE